MNGRVSFFAIGHPEPAGSKRAFSGGGKTWVVDANAKAKPWQAVVANAAADAMPSEGGMVTLMEGPLGLAVTFTLARPKGHFGKRGVRPAAPSHPIARPDATKLVRGVEDALTGVVWRDDAQVVEQLVVKRYGEPEGARVEVWRL